MPTHSSKNKRIFKNTMVLYVRMIVVMLISLYTSRVVLKALGMDDFGLYNVVGGVVGLLTFFSTTMTKATQRFLNIAMVKSNKSLTEIFSSSITVHLMIAAIFFILGETVGLWFLNTKINVPESRNIAANMVYQATICSFCVSIVMIPYNAVVVAYEKMTFVAIVSMIDAIFKVAIALFLFSYNNDRLSLYGFLLFAITVLNFVMYFLYSYKNYPFLKFRLSFNKENFKEIFGFVSWTLLGQFAIVGCNQGNVVLLNLFHPLVANAAMSVGSQINHAVTNLTSNFQTAFNPQITKSYASSDYSYLRSLVYSASKISFCILFVVALPIAYNIDWILNLWLDKVPPLSNIFAILFMVNGIMNALSSPFNYTVLSSNNIRNYQIVISVIFIMDLPLVYLLFTLGFPPITVLVVKVCIMIIAMFMRICFASRVVPTINVFSYIKNVLFFILCTAFISISFAFVLNGMTNNIQDRIAFTFLIEIVCLVSIWTICLSTNERNKLIQFMKFKKN